MGFSLPNFLKRTPPASLREYIETTGFSGFDGIDWSAKAPALSMRFREIMDALPEYESSRVQDDFERVDQLCDEAGQRALQSVLGFESELLNAVRASDSNEARGLLVLIRNDRAFDHALATAYAESFTNGRTWDAFSLNAPRIPAHDDSKIAALQSEISTIFKVFDGSGSRLKIEFFERRGHRFEGGAEATVIHYSVYVEGLPETELQFKSDEPTRLTRRPVIQAAICYEPGTGDIDIVSKGGRPVRKEIAHAFARCLLGSNDELERVEQRVFTLDRLKRPMPFPHDQADGIKNVQVTYLRLQNIASESGRVTIEKKSGDSVGIHDKSAGWFGDRDPLKLSDWRVTQAKLCIIFHPEARERRDKRITIDLRAPNGSNLKDQTRRHQLVSRKCLPRWELVERP